MTIFKNLSDLLQENFKKITNNGTRPLFVVNADKDVLWNLYLDSFPEGTNEVYRVRREYDCSCCRHFMRDMANVVYIDDDTRVHSIFEFDTHSNVFQPVMDALAKEVVQYPIIGQFLHKEANVGYELSRELDPTSGKVTTWNHFHLTLPDKYCWNTPAHRNMPRTTIGSMCSEFNGRRNVFKRSLDEITMDSVDTVLELIESNSLYRGAEWFNQLKMFKGLKEEYADLDPEQKENFAWARAYDLGVGVSNIRNHSIGTLLVDISAGMELDEAVRRYEAIVAPANYKRPKAIYTKRMLEEAEKTVTELGYLNSLGRKFATLDDIRANNILFSNRDAKRRMEGEDIFASMKHEVETVDPKKFSRVDEIGIEDFISKVLPTAKAVEVLFENRHSQNLMSLIAPKAPNAPSMFKWSNGFSWAYSGNMADSDIRENVKMAGGNVNGFMRFSIQWNDDPNEWDRNDLDAHCREFIKNYLQEHIFFHHKTSNITGAALDVDIIDPSKGKPAVENIVYATERMVRPGKYEFGVHCYNYMGGKKGFRAELEVNGKIWHFDYNKAMHAGEYVKVAEVEVTADQHRRMSYAVKEALPSSTSSKDIWGVKTNQFVPVTVIMNSPNYWNGESGIGNKHYFFMMAGCVNPENPNGFYNEFLNNELYAHRKVFEALGSRMAVEDCEDQLSGIGFSSTKRNDVIVRVEGATQRVMIVKF